MFFFFMTGMDSYPVNDFLKDTLYDLEATKFLQSAVGSSNPTNTTPFAISQPVHYTI